MEAPKPFVPLRTELDLRDILDGTFRDNLLNMFTDGETNKAPRSHVILHNYHIFVDNE